jgi:ubiquinone/menaquinone biosynthesis C-methylase UbiE
MKNDSLEIYATYYDQIYLNAKDYQKEANNVKDIIKKYEKKHPKNLLDVGCGTGEHLRHLSKDFQCTGIDINPIIIKTAKKKVPNANFKVADMTNFRLREKFDVITCLFSSIGYVQNFASLLKTLENFHDQLGDDGLVVIEPWVFKKDFKKG